MIERDSMGDILWRTSYGEVIRIEDMEDDHLKNSIAWIRYRNWRLEYLPYLTSERARRQLKITDPEESKKKKEVLDANWRQKLEEQEEEERHQLREV